MPFHRHSRRQFLMTSLGGAALAAGPLRTLASTMAATAWPERPLSFICPWPAGGTADQTMRALCAAAAKDLGQSIAVDNRPGAAGMLGLRTMASARPDGYTIGQIPISITRFSQLGSVQLDPKTDLTYLARTSGQTFGIAVRSDSPWTSLQELVTAAQAAPGKLTYGSSGVGGATHVGMEEFAAAAGIRMNHIAYKGGAPALVDLLGGQIDALADSSSWAPHVSAGKLRLLATWGDKRTHDFPDAPTLREAGYDVVVDAPNGVGAPKGLDPAITAKLRDTFRKAVASEEFVTACRKIDVPVLYLDGPDYQHYVDAVYDRETKLIERLNLRELMSKG